MTRRQDFHCFFSQVGMCVLMTSSVIMCFIWPKSYSLCVCLLLEAVSGGQR
jgi:hypothetical protein